MRRALSMFVALTLSAAGLMVLSPSARAGPPAETFKISGVSQNEGNSGTSVFSFTVTLSNAPQSGETASVKYGTSDGDAQSNDYVATSGLVEFTAGSGLARKIDVTVNGDVTPEPDEAFLVTLSAPGCSPAGCNQPTIDEGTAKGVILNDDQASAFSVGNVTQNEGNTGTSTFAFTVTLSSAPQAGQTASVKFGTTNGTAQSGSDYVTTGGAVEFAAGETTKTIPVTVNGDTTAEPNETFFVNLEAPGCLPAGCTPPTIANGQGKGTITNDDAAPPPSAATLNISDGQPSKATPSTDCVLTVTLGQAAGNPATVDFATVDGSAKAGKQYTAQKGTLIFAPGDTSKAITVQVIKQSGKTKTFSVMLSEASGASIQDASGTCSIKRKKH